MTDDIKLLSEDDYLSAMTGPGKAWRDEHVTAGDLQSFDCCSLRYYRADRDEPVGYIVMVHGFCEFWGKYHELAWYFWQLGYSVFFLEQRGHGYSGGKMKESDVVHIDDYRTYVSDLKAFMDRVVVPAGISGKRVLFAHSMGGAVSTLFLEEYPGYFDRAIFSSPMLKMKTKLLPEAALSTISIYGKMTGKLYKMAPGQPHWDGINVFATSSSLSRARYDYLFNQRIEDVHYQTYGASLGWGIASMRADRRLMKEAEKVTIPVTIMSAGKDHLVDRSGYYEFAEKAENVTVIEYPDSRHELYNADEVTRKQYLMDVFSILRE